MSGGYYQARVASNIAFIKYWGKRDVALQWPANDSLSMTLDALATETRAQRIDAPDHRFIFQGQAMAREAKQFQKAFQHLDRLQGVLGATGTLEIASHNHFPLGAGMASSASGLAALTLAALAAWLESPDLASLEARGYPRSELAQLARLGSGSAGRSLFGGYVLWEAGERAEEQRIVPLQPASQWALRDSVIVFEAGEKGLSSSAAHLQAWSSPLFAPRLAGIKERLKAVEQALAQRDMALLGPLLEAEALEMHAVIMTAQAPHAYLNKPSLDFLAALRLARQAGEIEAYFTIDAGPNIHIIHEEHAHEALLRWLKKNWPEQLLLHDRVGRGPHLEYLSE